MNTIKAGDIITMEGRPKRTFWQWLTGRPATRPPLMQFVVTADSTAETRAEMYERCLGKSDDWAVYRARMIQAFEAMTGPGGPATPEDFERHGGWIRSVSTPTRYFMYAGTGLTIKQRYYLDILTGKVSQS